MSKKKHQFVHPDPERQPVVTKKGTQTKKKNKVSENENYGFIKEDLRRSVITISLFVFILIIFYLINDKYDILNSVKNIQF